MSVFPFVMSQALSHMAPSYILDICLEKELKRVREGKNLNVRKNVPRYFVPPFPNVFDWAFMKFINYKTIYMESEWEVFQSQIGETMIIPTRSMYDLTCKNFAQSLITQDKGGRRSVWKFCQNKKSLEQDARRSIADSRVVYEFSNNIFPIHMCVYF